MPAPPLPPDDERRLSLEACDVLNDFIGDLVAGVMVFREYVAEHRRGRVPLAMMVPVQRMCVAHILLGLYKFEEFWRRYMRVVPQEHTDACRAVMRELARREVADFRNSFAGHLLNRDKSGPMTNVEMERAFVRLAPEGAEQFFRWVNDAEGRNPYPTTVVSVCEAVRNALMLRHGFTPDQIMGR